MQEFSAVYVNENGHVVDVFHQHVRYPFSKDYDVFARRYIHGLNRDFLAIHGLQSESELLSLFREWLKSHPYDHVLAHAPSKEMYLLGIHVQDVALKPWKERTYCKSHRTSIFMKRYAIPICGVTCFAHDIFVKWKPRRTEKPTVTDTAKMAFSYHCSLYDCVECVLFYMSN